MKPFAHRDFVVERAGSRKTVPDLSGLECEECREVFFDDRSSALYAEAGDALVLAERRRAGDELRRIRTKLGLSQQEAASITGGGHNAFSRYERGEAVPVLAVTNLMRILDRHPHLLSEIAPSGRTNVVHFQKATSSLLDRAPAKVHYSRDDQALAASASTVEHDFRVGSPTIGYNLVNPNSNKITRIEIRRRTGQMQARWMDGERLEVRTQRKPERFALLPQNRQWTHFDAGGEIINDDVLGASFGFPIDNT